MKYSECSVMMYSDFGLLRQNLPYLVLRLSCREEKRSCRMLTSLTAFSISGKIVLQSKFNFYLKWHCKMAAQLPSAPLPTSRFFLLPNFRLSIFGAPFLRLNFWGSIFGAQFLRLIFFTSWLTPAVNYNYRD